MKKNGFVGIALASLVVATIALVLARKSPQKEEARGPILSQSQVEQIERIVLERKTEQLVFARSEKGEWLIESDNRFPADAKKISSFFETLVSGKIERTVAKKSDRLGEFGLGENGLKIKLENSGKPVLALEVGDVRPGGGRYFKYQEDSTTYLLNSNITADLGVEPWIYKTILKLPRKEIQSIGWEQGRKLEKKFTYSRKKAEEKFELTPASGEVKEDQFNQLLDQLENLTFTRREPITPNAQAKLAKTPLRRIHVTLFNGQQASFLSHEVVPKSEELAQMELILPQQNSDASKPTPLDAGEFERMLLFSKNYRFLFPTKVALGK